MKWLNTPEKVFLDESDVAFIKVAVHRQSEQLIKKAQELEARLKSVSLLSTISTGYWKSEDVGGTSYVVCTCCNQRVRGFEWDTEDGSRMADYAKYTELSCYCDYCGSENSPVFTPSEYFSFLSDWGMNEDERRYKMDRFFEVITGYMDEIDFVVHDHSNEIEALLAYEEKAGKGNFPLFDVTGGVVYG